MKLESAVLLRSLAVAVKTLLERNEDSDQDASQISGRRVPVSGLLRHVSDAPVPMAVPAQAQGRGKPTGFGRGQLTGIPLSPTPQTTSSPTPSLYCFRSSAGTTTWNPLDLLVRLFRSSAKVSQGVSRVHDIKGLL